MPKKKTKKTERKSEKSAEKLIEAEFEKKVFELSEQGLTSEKIGETLRKREIHPAEYSRKISKILKEKYSNPDLKNIEEKLERIRAHWEKNKQDKRAMRERDRISAKLRIAKLYFNR